MQFFPYLRNIERNKMIYVFQISLEYKNYL